VLGIPAARLWACPRRFLTAFPQHPLAHRYAAPAFAGRQQVYFSAVCYKVVRGSL
jgi:hypothetical protein